MFGYHVGGGRDHGEHGSDLVANVRSAIDIISGYVDRPVVQIFTRGPQSYQPTIAVEQYQAMVRATANATLVIHGAYLDAPWNGNIGAAHNIQKELATADALNATGVIIHLSKATGTHIDIIGNLIENTHSTLWLEINAAKPSKNTFETPLKLTVLIEQIAKYNKQSQRVGICVDTAHLHSCGVSLTTYEQAHDWFTKVWRKLKANNIPLMIHLNDSKSDVGSGIDRHIAMTRGKIWESFADGRMPLADSGIAFIVEFARTHNIACVLEHSEGLIADLTIINQLG